MEFNVVSYGFKSCGIIATDVASFDGDSYLRIDLTNQPVIATEDRLHFRFKTIQSDGLIIYSHGFQGDIFVVQLLNSILLVTVGLGGGRATTVRAGSAADDGVWHAVSVARMEYRLEVWYDGVAQVLDLEHGYYKLNLEQELFVGGMLHLRKPFIKVRQVFLQYQLIDSFIHSFIHSLVDLIDID